MKEMEDDCTMQPWFNNGIWNKYKYLSILSYFFICSQNFPSLISIKIICRLCRNPETRPLSLQPQEETKAKRSPGHTSCLTFSYSNRDKNAEQNRLAPPSSSSDTGGYIPPLVISVRMGETLSTHPESKEAGCSSVTPVCPFLMTAGTFCAQSSASQRFQELKSVQKTEKGGKGSIDSSRMTSHLLQPGAMPPFW